MILKVNGEITTNELKVNLLKLILKDMVILMWKYFTLDVNFQDYLILILQKDYSNVPF